MVWAPFYKRGLDLISAWMSNHMSSNLCGQITYPFPNFNGGIVDCWDWVSNFVSYFIMYGGCGYFSMMELKSIHVNKRGYWSTLDILTMRILEHTVLNNTSINTIWTIHRSQCKIILLMYDALIQMFSINVIPLDILRNCNVVSTSKRRHFDVITSKWRRFDVITTSLLRNVSAWMLPRRHCSRQSLDIFIP